MTIDVLACKPRSSGPPIAARRKIPIPPSGSRPRPSRDGTRESGPLLFLKMTPAPNGTNRSVRPGPFWRKAEVQEEDRRHLSPGYPIRKINIEKILFAQMVMMRLICSIC